MCLLDLFKAFEIVADDSDRLCEMVNFLTDVAYPDRDPTPSKQISLRISPLKWPEPTFKKKTRIRPDQGTDPVFFSQTNIEITLFGMNGAGI